jgi:hypothetical protein
MSAKQVTPGSDQSGRPAGFRERDEIRVDELPFNWHHVAQQPDVQAQVVRQTSQQSHGNMGVSVDQARHEHLAAAIHDFASSICLAKIGFRPTARILSPRTATAPGSYWVRFSSMVRTIAFVKENIGGFCHAALQSA